MSTLEELLEERDTLGESMNTVKDRDERKELFKELKEIEEDLFNDYGIFPVYTGWGWKPSAPRKYVRKPRVPVRRRYHPELSSIPEHKLVVFRLNRSKSKSKTRSKMRPTSRARPRKIKSGRSRRSRK